MLFILINKLNFLDIIQDNITFYSSMNEEKYESIIKQFGLESISGYENSLILQHETNYLSECM